EVSQDVPGWPRVRPAWEPVRIVLRARTDLQGLATAQGRHPDGRLGSAHDQQPDERRFRRREVRSALRCQPGTLARDEDPDQRAGTAAGMPPEPCRAEPPLMTLH